VTGKRTILCMMLIMLGFGAASLRWQETLPVGDGFGWDGVNYAAWAKDFNKCVFVDHVEDFYVQRVLPSAIVHYGTRAVLWPFYSHDQSFRFLNESKNLLLAFGIYNLVLLLLAVYVWGLIADHLEFSERRKWFGFCFLFVNYATLKLNFYTPVATDTTAFLLGLLMFYFFLAGKPMGLFAVMIVGSFTWPTLPFTAWLLLVLPRPSEPLPEGALQSTPGLRRFALFLSLFGCALVAGIYAYLSRDILRGWTQAGMVRINFGLLYSSMAAVLVYIFWGFRPVFVDKRLFDVRHILGEIRWRWVAAGALVILGSRLVVHQLAGPVPSQWTFKDFLIYIFASALTEPFIFVVGHVVYYGPVILLLMMFWKPFCETIKPYGVGFRLFVAMNLLLSLCPQSRYQVPVVGAFVIILVKVLDEEWLSRWSLSTWLLLSLFYSKVWYTFNTSPMNPDGTMAVFQTFPLQHFFMNSGPWMSHSMYLVQGSVVLVTGAVLFSLGVSGKMRGRAAH